jgi:hypothetical protein
MTKNLPPSSFLINCQVFSWFKISMALTFGSSAYSWETRCFAAIDMLTKWVSTCLEERSILNAGEKVCSENKSIESLWNRNRDHSGNGSPDLLETSYLIKNLISRFPARDAFIWMGMSISYPQSKDLNKCLFSKLKIKGCEHITKALSIVYSLEQFFILNVPFLHSDKTICLF